MSRKNKPEIVILIIVLLVAAFLRFFNLMHDSPYFFNPDERNMANAVSQFRLPSDISQIPICLISQISPILTHNLQLTTHNCNLNPHFFAYGQFPLYLAFASDQISKIPISLISPISQIQPTTHNPQLTTNFPSAIFWLRFWSALTSILSVLMVYLITKKLFHLEIGHYAALLAAFTPGLIQSAHFGTTESLLTFFFLASMYLSLVILRPKAEESRTNMRKQWFGFTHHRVAGSFAPLRMTIHWKYVILLSIAIGLALGSKLTGIFFFIPPFISLITRTIIVRQRQMGLWPGLFENLRIGLFILIGSIFFFILSSPYNFIEPENFKSAVFGYEADVAWGKYEAFYTRQFVNTTPILFQMEKIFPYALGWPVFILGTLGFLLMNFKFNNYKIYNSFIILNLSFIIYFLPNAFLFAKWTRFMTPILPFFTIFAGYFLYQISKIKYQRYISNIKIFNFLYVFFIFNILFLILLPGVAFMSIYTREDSRIQASKWIYTNIPNNSYILSETANVVDIPLPINNQQLAINNYTIISFDFYHLDENPRLFEELLNHLEQSDYIFIPSRRIFKNYLRLPERYLLTTKYYQLLFSSKLGFEKVAEFSSFPRLPISQIGPIRLITNDENAEETFTVFDHPVIRIYRKAKPFTIEQYRSLFEI